MSNSWISFILLNNMGKADYGGIQEKCEYCGRQFTYGELVIVYEKEDKVCCCRGETKKAQAECAQKWAIARGIVTNMKCAEFHGNT